MGKVTTEQLARYLNLSRSTVSKALNGHSSVSEATRKIVLKTAYQFGYMEYPAHAESLSMVPREGAVYVLLVAEMVKNRFWNVMLDGLEDYLFHNGYPTKKMILDQSMIAGGKAVRIPDDAVGLIVVGSRTRQLYKMIVAQGKPVVSIDTSADTQGNNLLCDVVMMNNRSCVYEIASYMIRYGRKKIAFIGNKYQSLSVWERWHGYQQALMEFGTVNRAFEPLLKISLDADKPLIYNTLSQLDTLPDACICANDVLAINTYQALEHLHLSVPKDVMLSGFDCFDSMPIERRFLNELTSVAFDIREVGRIAARQLLYRIEASQAPFGIYSVESKVVYRASTEVDVERIAFNKQYL